MSLKSFFCALIIISIALPSTLRANENPVLPEEQASKLYQKLALQHNNLPDITLFQKAYTGFYTLKSEGLIKKDILTIIDFDLSSIQKRMWVIDLKNMKVLFNTLVAHGKNSGEEYANHFSNTPESNKSSLGFYITSETYHGKHGLSLYLEGVEQGINDNARMRSIVMHGADYVSKDFISKHGRLGRSFGCPAIPMELRDEIIDELKNGSCLFIYHPDKRYEQNSAYLTNIMARKN